MAYISEDLRQEVTDRARGRCEYCQTQQVIVVAMEIDPLCQNLLAEKQLSTTCVWRVWVVTASSWISRAVSTPKRNKNLRCSIPVFRIGTTISGGVTMVYRLLA